jgi:hypothetical protein
MGRCPFISADEDEYLKKGGLRQWASIIFEINFKLHPEAGFHDAGINAAQARRGQCLEINNCFILAHFLILIIFSDAYKIS